MNEKESIELTKSQYEVMKEFYNIAPTKVIFNKKQRAKIWKSAINHESIDFDYLEKACPALAHRIKLSYESSPEKEHKNIQSAVFSECVYAQTYANMLNLSVFINCYERNETVSNDILKITNRLNLYPRYIYMSADKNKMLIQAGSCDGIDSALVSVISSKVFTIEFKEQHAKASEPDLPEYGEDGILVIDSLFLGKNHQFEKMVEEQKSKRLNFFEHIGHNINNFSPESIRFAISNNYTNNEKIADIICTEDKDGYLTIIPSGDAKLWAKLEGEIRPAGRNKYAVWTPNALKKFLLEKNAVFSNEIVTVEKSKLEIRKGRGSGGKITGYKINSLFFVYVEKCSVAGDKISFDISDVYQLKPTITAKMDFRKTLKYDDVKKYYSQVLFTEV